MLKAFQNGDVVIKEALLQNSSSRVSILGQLVALDIFEDMAKPTVFCTVHMLDAIDLLGKFPIIGEETLTISFETPGISDPATYRFAVFAPENIQQNDNRTAIGYTLKCVSEEHLVNGQVEVLQSFSDTLANVVTAVGTNYLRSRKRIAVEQSKGIQTVVSPKWTPLRCIDFCRQQAVSIRYPSSSYVFFETQSGFNFKTVEALMDEGRRSIGSRVFSFIQSPSSVPQNVSYRSILEHEQIKRNDTVSTLQDGVLFAETETFDILNKTSSKQQFRIDETFQKFSTSDERSEFNQSATFTRKFGTGDPTRFFMFRDSSRGNDYAHEARAARNAFKSLLNGSITRCLVHGDSGLRAGDVVTLRLPEIVGSTGAKSEDEQYSGNYILLRLRHIITAGPKPRHEIAFDAAKVGVRS